MLRFLVLLACCCSTAPALAADPLSLAWDASTLRLVQRGADYGRMARLTDSRLACVYDHAGGMWIRHSEDEGVTWADAIEVAREPGSWLTNAYLLPLRTGEVLYFWNDRPVEPRRSRGSPTTRPAEARSFRIRMARSDDQGRTWSAPQTLYSGGTRFGDGCWEPAALELPDGELHVYFANEAPYRSSDEQEISLVRSIDGGRTWLGAQTVSLRKSCRDGMPAPLLVADCSAILLAIEDNGIAPPGFKPVIARTTLSDRWKSGAVSGDSPARWSALADPLPDRVYGGAPFLAQLPTGHLVLSYQESEIGTVETSRLAVVVAGSDGRDFSGKSYPLPPSAAPGQNWNALFVKNRTTLTAVTTATIDGTRGVWSIDARIIVNP